MRAIVGMKQHPFGDETACTEDTASADDHGADAAGSTRMSEPWSDDVIRQMSDVSELALFVPTPGELIAGKYRIEERLGRGGMSLVFRATHVISNKQVALKWMLSPSSSAQANARFIREARAAARVDHPNVVDVYDIAQDGHRGLYMVMQLLQGESLAKRLARGPLAPDEAISLLLPALRGVVAVHAAGVIHRDLKPDNIFLCVSGERELPEAKVLDFGISAIVHEMPDAALTRDGALVGTPAYMSPEQIQDARTVDARTDVYALGVILYQALTGQLPFESDSQQGLSLAIVRGDVVDPRTMRPQLPVWLSDVVLRALATRREDRYPSVAALIDALTHPSPRAARRMPTWPYLLAAAAVVGLFVCRALLEAPAPAARSRNLAPTHIEAPHVQTTQPPTPSGAQPEPP
jgi:serine/threonine protein kinase